MKLWTNPPSKLVLRSYTVTDCGCYILFLQQIVQDKTIEDLVLDELYYDIVRNLPADDVALLMDEHKLLTSGQRDYYRMMKANHQPDVEKSEYLIDCLRKGEPGFLQRLCTILKTLPPSSYIADKIQGI